jgi:adenine-specific DNA-methyltransferase
MNRRWITIELGEHAKTHIAPRLNKAIDGEDQGGVTEATGWKGGGGYRFYRLAPSLLEKDPYDNWVISKEYDANKLSEAICKLMGFTYDPSDKNYWNHGYSTESDFIFITTNAMTYDALKALSAEVGAERSLMVCCKAFNADADAFDNLTLKKIPHAVVDQCEWGKDDYSLNVQNLPRFEDEASDEDDELDLFNALEGDDA